MDYFSEIILKNIRTNLQYVDEVAEAERVLDTLPDLIVENDNQIQTAISAAEMMGGNTLALAAELVYKTYPDIEIANLPKPEPVVEEPLEEFEPTEEFETEPLTPEGEPLTLVVPEPEPEESEAPVEGEEDEE